MKGYNIMSFTLTYGASDAYAKALEKSETKLNTNLKELDKLIVDAVERGEFSIIYDKELIYKTYHFDVLDLLTQFGYRVTEKTTKDNNTYWFISWDVHNYE